MTYNEIELGESCELQYFTSYYPNFNSFFETEWIDGNTLPEKVEPKFIIGTVSRKD